MNRSGERGVALLTVLLLVAVMSALAVSVLDDIRFGLRRSANAETMGQAQWYALGAESMARLRLAQLPAQDALRAKLEAELNGVWQTFPIDRGLIRARLSDAGTCFNLNSVVQGGIDQWSRRDLGIQQFIALLKALAIAPRDAEALAETLADWIDTDASRNTLGAEDDSYSNMSRPYRTSATLLAEVSELRAMRGFTPEIYARIRPYVCALPTAALSPININHVTAANAALLSMLMDGELGSEAVRRLIASRPEGGWQSVEQFWTNPALKDHLPPDPVLNQVTLRTRFFALEADVNYAGSEAVLTSLLEQQAPSVVKVTARRWTADE